MSAEIGVVIRYQLPDPEFRALERVQARAGDVDQVKAAMLAWADAGHPTVQARPRAPLSGESHRVFQAVTWWLRRSEARQALDPAKLATEVRQAAARNDPDAMRAALCQLRRIVGDLDHPDRERAKAELFAMMTPEDRARIGEWADRVEATLRPPKAQA